MERWLVRCLQMALVFLACFFTFHVLLSWLLLLGNYIGVFSILAYWRYVEFIRLSCALLAVYYTVRLYHK